MILFKLSIILSYLQKRAVRSVRRTKSAKDFILLTEIHSGVCVCVCVWWNIHVYVISNANELSKRKRFDTATP